MRALLLAACLFALGCGTHACREGTLFLHVVLDGASAGADMLAVTVDVDGQPEMGSGKHTMGAASGTVEIEFATYPKGHSVTVTIIAQANGVELGRGSSKPTTLSGSCAALSIEVGAEVGDAAAATDGSDASVMLDLAGTGDGAINTGGDLARPPDLATCVPDTSGARYVDNQLGTDDEQHGNAPGACANRTITYALAHAISISLQDGGAYDHDAGETLPLVLQNGQQLKCNGSTLTGTGVYLTVNDSTVIAYPSTLVQGCEMHAGGGAGHDGISLIAPDGGSDGGAIIQSCGFYDYKANAISNVQGGNNFLVKGSRFFRISQFGMLLNQGSATLQGNRFENATVAVRDFYCGQPLPGMVGCDNHTTDGGTPTCQTCANCAAFAAACP